MAKRTAVRHDQPIFDFDAAPVADSAYCAFCGCSPCRVANVVLTAGNYRQMAEWEAMTQAELIDKARKDDPKMLATYATLTERSKRRQALYESKARA